MSRESCLKWRKAGVEKLGKAWRARALRRRFCEGPGRAAVPEHRSRGRAGAGGATFDDDAGVVTFTRPTRITASEAGRRGAEEDADAAREPASV